MATRKKSAAKKSISKNRCQENPRQPIQRGLVAELPQPPGKCPSGGGRCWARQHPHSDVSHRLW